MKYTGDGKARLMIETRVNELLADGSKISPNSDQTIAGSVPDKVFACVGRLVRHLPRINKRGIGLERLKLLVTVL